MKNIININNIKLKEVIYQVVLPLNLAMNIPCDDSVRLLSSVLDTADLGGVVKDRVRQGKIPYIIMLKIVVYGYMSGIYSSRKIEIACRRDINFMWLLQGYPAPDHNTIARFRNALDSEMLFSGIIKILRDTKELDFKNVFIDGTKIEANANRYSFVWKKSVEKNYSKLQVTKTEFLEDIYSRYGIRFCTLRGVLDYLDLRDFICGKGKRKPQKQRDYEAALKLYEREERYNSYLSMLDGRNSLSKTDNDATFMRLKDDHMRNGQLKPAYNIQIAVENEYITGTYISSDRNDAGTLKPLLNKMEAAGIKYTNVTADSGYESEENYVYLKDNSYSSYIKPQNYEISKTRKFKSQINRKENMHYDINTDSFTCAEGRQLVLAGQRIRKSSAGYEALLRQYECTGCEGCSKKSLCTKSKGNRRIEFSPVFEKLKAQSLQNITSLFGTMLRINRSIQVEGAFGVLKQDYGFRRFLSRGKHRISTEFNLLAVAYNIQKLHNCIITGRLGSKLTPLKQE